MLSPADILALTFFFFLALQSWSSLSETHCKNPVENSVELPMLQAVKLLLCQLLLTLFYKYNMVSHSLRTLIFNSWNLLCKQGVTKSFKTL